MKPKELYCMYIGAGMYPLPQKGHRSPPGTKMAYVLDNDSHRYLLKPALVDV